MCLAAMRLLILAAICVMSLHDGSSAFAQDWAYAAGMLSRLDSSALVITHSVPVKRIDAMSSDGAGGIWYSMSDRLAHRDAAAAQVYQADVRALGLYKKVAWIAGDAHTSESWVSDGSRLVLLGSAGGLLLTRQLTAPPVAMAVAQSQNLWMLERSRLLELRRDGSLAMALDLRSALQADARHLALDDVGERVWAVGERRGVTFDAAGKERGRFALTETARDACVLAGQEGIWLLTAAALEWRGADGRLRSRSTLASLGVSRAVGLVCHWMRQEVWLVHDGGVIRFAADASVLGAVVLPFPVQVEPLALRALPEVRIVQPPDDALTSDPRPLFELALGPVCAAGPCPPLPSYLHDARVSAQIDGQQVGHRFQMDADAGSATYRPEAPLGEGSHRFAASLQDRFGHASEPVEISLAVDTVAPAFLHVAPDDGSVVSTSQITLAGTVDDALATVVLENAGTIGAVTLPALPGVFSFSVPVQPGSNVFTLSAVDRAGNVTARTIRIVRIADQIAATVAAPADGATVLADSVIVRGTVSAGGQRVGVSVNGEPAVLIGDTFYAQVPLQPGPNVLEVRVTGADGGVSTRSLTVTRQGSRLFRAHVWPATGIAPSAVRFQAVPQGTRSAVRIQIDYQGDGSIDHSTNDPSAELRFTYATPGVYNARMLVTDTAGYVESHTLQVVVQDLATVDQELKAVLHSMLSSLRAGQLDAALHAFSPAVRARYRPLFELARPSLAFAVDGLGTVQNGSIVGSMAEYVMVQDRTSGPKAYFVYLIRAKDGLWRIQQM